jgi:hypothetical protein
MPSPVPSSAAPRRSSLRSRRNTTVGAALLAGAVLLTAQPAAAATPLRSLVSAVGTTSTVKLATGTYSFADFQPRVGLVLGGRSLTGAGRSSTVVQMNAYSSTRRSSVPTATGSSNPLNLVQATGSPRLSNFTLQGTPQGHLYNGLQLYSTSGATVSSVKIDAIPGNAHVPPGETFGLNDLRTSSSQYTDLEIDGAGVGASGFAANMSKNVSVTRGYFHDNPYSAGLTLYRTTNATLTDVRSIGNHMGLNFEQDSGTINVVRPNLQISSANGGFDFFIGGYTTAAKVNIYDPVLPAGKKLRILLKPTYGGKPNAQKRSDVHVYVNGVDRTSTLVTWF